MPFITEEIWQRIAPRVGKTGKSIMVEPFPGPEPSAISAAVEAEAQWTMASILGVRAIRGEFDIAPSHQAAVFIENASARGSPPLRCERLGHLQARRDRRKCTGCRPGSGAAVGDGDGRRHEDPPAMAGLIDVDAELARLGKRRSKVEQELARAKRKARQREFRTQLRRRTWSPRNASVSRGSSVNWLNFRSSTSG
jgi:valyl-tRNA synthetase